MNFNSNFRCEIDKRGFAVMPNQQVWPGGG